MSMIGVYMPELGGTIRAAFYTPDEQLLVTVVEDNVLEGQHVVYYDGTLFFSSSDRARTFGEALELVRKCIYRYDAWPPTPSKIFT